MRGYCAPGTLDVAALESSPACAHTRPQAIANPVRTRRVVILTGWHKGAPSGSPVGIRSAASQLDWLRASAQTGGRLSARWRPAPRPACSPRRGRSEGRALAVQTARDEGY